MDGLLIDGKSIMQVKVLWDTDKDIWEPLNNMKADDPVTVAQYVEKKGFVDKSCWKWANQYLKNKKKFLRLYAGKSSWHIKRMDLCTSLRSKLQGPPEKTKEALLLDQQNKNNL